MYGLYEFWSNLGPFFGGAAGIFWVWMFIDCLCRAKVRGQRLLWVMLLFVFNWVGALVYFSLYVFPTIPLFRQYTNIQTRQVYRKTQVPQAVRPIVQPYQKTYQQGYQAYQLPYSSVPTPSSTYQQEQYASSYDEQPQATYPEMPQQQQQ